MISACKYLDPKAEVFCVEVFLIQTEGIRIKGDLGLYTVNKNDLIPLDMGHGQGTRICPSIPCRSERKAAFRILARP